jgi:thymidylate synthase ThyX
MTNSNTLCSVQSVSNELSDSLVVKAARVSFDNDNLEFDLTRDEKLINYLVNHDHWSPLSHPRGSFLLKGDFFNKVHRELLTSPIHGLSWGSSYNSPSAPVAYVYGSLWGLLHLGVRYSDDLIAMLLALCPLSTKAFLKKYGPPQGSFPCQLNLHDTPGNESFTFRIEAPLSCARQLWKHQVGMAFSEEYGWNEVSGRYIDMDTFDTYVPTAWRAPSSTGAKQGSDANTLVTEDLAFVSFNDLVKINRKWYDSNPQICNEQRRMALPQAQKTAWYWTANKKRWMDIINLRMDPHAQLETQQIVTSIKEIICSAI